MKNSRICRNKYTIIGLSYEKAHIIYKTKKTKQITYLICFILFKKLFEDFTVKW